MEILIKSLHPDYKPKKDKIIYCLEQAVKILTVEADEMSIIFTSDEQIRMFNRKYRNIDRETDVLSFPLGERNLEGKINLGDIIISIDTAERQAQELGHSVDAEIKILIIHGLLHLLSYDHETDDGEMKKKEQELLSFL
jgi:probable rRNA maturation factor